MQTSEKRALGRPYRPDSIDNPLLVSVPEAARLLGVGKTLAWEMARNGDLPKVNLGKRVLIPRGARATRRQASSWDRRRIDPNDGRTPTPQPHRAH